MLLVLRSNDRSERPEMFANRLLSVTKAAGLFSVLMLFSAAALGDFSAQPGANSLFATALSTSRIRLAWHYNPTDETKFYLERSPDGTGAWQVLLPEIGPNVTSFV